MRTSLQKCPLANRPWPIPADFIPDAPPEVQAAIYIASQWRKFSYRNGIFGFDDIYGGWRRFRPKDLAYEIRGKDWLGVLTDDQVFVTVAAVMLVVLKKSPHRSRVAA